MSDALLSIGDVLLYVIIQLLIYFPLGYLLLGRSLRTIPFMIKLPILFSVGMIAADIILCLIGVFYIGSLTLLVVGGISYAILVVRAGLAKKLSIKKLRFAIVAIKWPSIVAGIVTVLVIIHFSVIAGYLGWPPQGDVIVHGLLTSILASKGAIQSTLAPIAPTESWFEPFGLHVLSANLSVLFDIFPANSVFVAGTTITILVLLLVYSIVFLLTRSTIFAIIGLLSGFFISSINVEHWLLGYYYNGPYANLFGYLALLCYLSVQFVIPSVKSNGINRQLETIGHTGFATLITMIGMLIIYPPFSVLPLLHLVGSRIVLLIKRLSSHWRSPSPSSDVIKMKSDDKKRVLGMRLIAIRAAVVVAVVVVAVIGLSFYFEALSNILEPYLLSNLSSASATVFDILERLQRLSYLYSLTFDDFFADIRGPLTILIMVCAIVSIIKRKLVYLSSFYLFLSTMILLSIWEVTSQYVWFLLSRRLFVFLNILSWIMLFTYLNQLRVSANLKLDFVRDMRKKTLDRNIVFSGSLVAVLALIVLFLLPFLIANLSLEQVEKWGGWFPRSVSFRNDYELVVWISNNIDPKDLIMVDNSFTSLFINSMTLKNLTSAPFILGQEAYVQRSLDNLIAWERPELLREFVQKYDVKYVALLTSAVNRNPSVLGGNNMLYWDKYTSAQYHNLFNKMPFLEPVATNGLATIYKVTNTDRA